MTIDVLQHKGSIEDMRGSLKLMNPQSNADKQWILSFLVLSLDYEIKNKNRVTVIRLLQEKINSVKKYKDDKIHVLFSNRKTPQKSF